MKKYLTPSIEINKFDVEDVITASPAIEPANDGTLTNTLTTDGAQLYNDFAGAAGQSKANGGVAEFKW